MLVQQSCPGLQSLTNLTFEYVRDLVRKGFSTLDDGRTGEGSRPPRTRPIASAFGDTDGEFFDRKVFSAKNFSTENVFAEKFSARKFFRPKQFSAQEMFGQKKIG